MTSRRSSAVLVAVVLTATLTGCNKTPPAPEAAAAAPSATPGPTPSRLAKGTSPAPVGEDTSSAAKVFEERILPIFKSPDPSSCARCHLTSVDIKDYRRRMPE